MIPGLRAVGRAPAPGASRPVPAFPTAVPPLPGYSKRRCSPANIDALNTLAMAELRLGKPEQAEKRLEQALGQLPGGLESSALLMRTRLSQGDVKGAEEAIEECYRRYPQSAEVALVMGRFYLVSHRPQLAEEQFRRAIRI